MEAKKILVIDDEKPILDMLKQGLEMNPEFDVRISENVEEYEELIFKDTFDVILLDHRMPVNLGSNLAKKIREEEGPNKETIIIFMSGNIKEVKSEAGSLSKAFFLQKPLVLKELFELIASC